MRSLSKRLLGLCIMFTLIFASCQSKHSNDSIKKNDTIKIDHSTEISEAFDSMNVKIPSAKNFSYNDEFESGLYKVIVTTYYINDTLSDYEAWEAVQWPIVERQEISFKYKDSVCKIFNFPTKKILKQKKTGGSVKAAEMIIWDVNFIEGDKTVLLGVFEATGLCLGSYCPVYNGLFKLNGEPIYQLYKNASKREILILGKKASEKSLPKEKISYKLDSVYNAYGISKEILHKSRAESKRIGINKI